MGICFASALNPSIIEERHIILAGFKKVHLSGRFCGSPDSEKNYFPNNIANKQLNRLNRGSD